MPTYYERLEIDPTSSQEGIKKAYHKMALTYHPDVNKSDEARDKMKLINEAYEVLSDPEKRADYDSKLRMKKPDLIIVKREREEAENDGVGRDREMSSSDYRVYENELRRHARAQEPQHTGNGTSAGELVWAPSILRIYSAILDFILMGVSSFIIVYLLLSLIPELDQAFIPLVFFVSFLYCAFFESSKVAATPGKWYFYIYVCDAKGGPISIRSAIIRSFVKVSTIYVIFYIAIIGYPWLSILMMIGVLLLLYLNNWTLHDYLARTLVAKKDRYAI